MATEARNWKWMVPAGLVAVFGVPARALLLHPSGFFQGLGVVCCVLALVCGVAAIGNYVDYRREHVIDFLERRKHAESMTQLSVRLEAARGVHPEVARRLLEESHRVWALKAGNRDLRVPAHSVLYAAPEVTDFFVRFVLENSTEMYVMAKHRLVEGRKNRFDPWGAVDEYTMYDALMRVWAADGRIVKYSEFEPYAWAQPWTPRVVAEDYGLEWDPSLDPSPNAEKLNI